MIQRIKSHNLLNGIRFSTAEFLVIGVVISPFAIYYLIHAQIVYGLIALGIVLNSLTVAAFGVSQWLGKEKGIGLQGLLDKQAREQIDRTNPHLLKDTTTITLTTLVPFVLTALVMYEMLTAARERKP